MRRALLLLGGSSEWYFLNSVAADGWPILQLGGAAPSSSTTSTGWRVEGLAAGQFARMAWGVVRPASAFGATAQPSGGPDTTLKDAWRVATPLTGTITAGAWTVRLPLIAVVGPGANVRPRVRVWRSVTADGSGATEITSGAGTGSGVTNLQTTPAQLSAVTLSLPGVTLSGEYLFVQVACETLVP